MEHVCTFGRCGFDVVSDILIGMVVFTSNPQCKGPLTLFLFEGLPHFSQCGLSLVCKVTCWSIEGATAFGKK